MAPSSLIGEIAWVGITAIGPNSLSGVLRSGPNPVHAQTREQLQELASAGIGG
jgi:hypothetical protein